VNNLQHELQNPAFAPTDKGDNLLERTSNKVADKSLTQRKSVLKELNEIKTSQSKTKNAVERMPKVPKKIKGRSR